VYLVVIKIVSAARPMYEATGTEEVNAESAEKLIFQRSMDQARMGVTLNPGPRTQREVWKYTQKAKDPMLGKGMSGM